MRRFGILLRKIFDLVVFDLIKIPLITQGQTHGPMAAGHNEHVVRSGSVALRAVGLERISIIDSR
jgi:hypothetical protein